MATKATMTPVSVNGKKVTGQTKATMTPVSANGKKTPTPAQQTATYKAAVPATIPKTTLVTPPPVAPFLTAAQQSALDAWNLQYHTYMDPGGLFAQDIAGRTATTNNAISSDKLSTAQTKDVDTQGAAARGVFQSSIQTNNMADLDAALALRINTLNTNLNTYVSGIQGREKIMSGQNTAKQNYYTGLAANNATAEEQANGTAVPYQQTTQVPNPAYAQLNAAKTTSTGQAAQHPVSAPAPVSVTPEPKSTSAPKVPSSAAGQGKNSQSTGATITFTGSK